MPNEQQRMEEAGSLEEAPPVRAAAPHRRPAARFAVIVGSALLAVGTVIGGYTVLRNLPNNGLTQECPDEELSLISAAGDKKPFDGWGKPDLVVVVTGQMHGYIFPCGCSEPQYGGLIRRQTLIDELKAKGWDIVGMDIGELAPTTGIPRQRELKIEYTLKALDLMGYKAYGLGAHELNMGLINFLGIHSLNNPSPRPVASTLNGAKKFSVHAEEIVHGDQKSSPRIGVLSLTGPDLEVALNKNNDKDLQFLNNQMAVLPGIQKSLANAKPKIDLAVMFYHESPANAPNPLQADAARRTKADMTAKAWEAARNTNKNIPPLGIIAIVTDEPEPPFGMMPVKGTPTHILEIGHKGKYVGAIGIYKNGKKLDMKYEVVLIDPSYQPKPGQKNKVLDVLQEYAKRVEKEDLLDKYIRTPHPTQVDPQIQKAFGGAHYVGSDACKTCHKAEYAIWKETDHAKHAFASLVKANKPSLREFDPECVVCHTTGFKHPEGWNELPQQQLKALVAAKAGVPAIRLALKAQNDKLASVGCESCHGPGSAHVTIKNKGIIDQRVDDLMNPFRPTPAEANAQGAAAKKLFKTRMEMIERFCVTCHDDENDVNWHKLLGKDTDFDKWVGKGIIHNDKNNPGNRFLPPVPPPAIRADNGKKE
jgi:hypothetical protein